MTDASESAPPPAETVLVTGASSGIGLGLARAWLERGARVLCLQRRPSPLGSHAALTEVRHDLTDFEQTPSRVRALLEGVSSVDRVILNSGVSSGLADLVDTPISELRRLMDVNTWSNKVLVDALLASRVPIRQVVGISSGAAVNGNRGWNGYALSKAAFVMLVKLYAAERPDIHFSSLAPGLVQTRMQDDLCTLDEQARRRFPSVERLLAARGTELMPDPDQVAPRLITAFDRLLELPSGSFSDIRQMSAERAQS